MSTNAVETKYRKDYQPSDFLIEKTELFFDLTQEGFVTVKSRLHIAKNPEVDTATSLVLDGEQLELLSISIDGEKLEESLYEIDETSLTINQVKEHFVLETQVKIHPDNNTSLEGLYRSGGMFCTQCEAQGFRKITYYLDRPDVLSEFKTTIRVKASEYKTVLSNGNCVADNTSNEVREVTWHDPFKKPCYLFALVAGNLEHLHDTFTTMTGRVIDLYIYVEQKDLTKCDHAMLSLKNSMRWDEEKYGREYDLDLFMIVAVDDFNMGAMENKGLNIFNTSCVLAHSDTTTDLGFQRVEAVVAHEYFHNWSGNRVTCRDWFQLSLKEGFTVYRDSEFSADMNDRAVKRIEDASFLRTRQFAEDAGPMAHPIRPDSFIEISNFYTLTIYEKGAEVVRMLATLVGKETFRKACDDYFERFDGTAATCEDFVQCMERASGLDLSQFRLWYEQAGTPKLVISSDYDQEAQSYSLTIEQVQPKTPAENSNKAMHIPLKVALLGKQSHTLLPLSCADANVSICTDSKTSALLNVTEAKQTFVFANMSEAVVPSLLREFSAPVYVDYAYSDEELGFLMQYDNDGFCRFDAAQNLCLRLLKALVNEQDNADDFMQQYELAIDTLLADEACSQALKAQLLQLPDKAYVLEQMPKTSPLQIHQAYEKVKLEIAKRCEQKWLAVYQASHHLGCDISNEAMAARSLKNVALSYLLLLGDKYAELAQAQYEQAENMTDRLAALKAIYSNTALQNLAESLLAQFFEQFKNEALVVNLWFQIQSMSEQEGTLAKVESLLEHPAFDIKNPNKVRALIGGFSQNIPVFHAAGGSGYALLAKIVAKLDDMNPQIASRLLAPLTFWQKFDEASANAMREALQNIADKPNLSKDVYEVVSKSLSVEAY